MCICSQFFSSYDSFHVIINLFQYVETVQNVHMRYPFESLNQLLPAQSSDSELFKKEDGKKTLSDLCTQPPILEPEEST